MPPKVKKTIAFLLLYGPVALIQNALLGWAQMELGITNEHVAYGIRLAIQLGIPALTVAVGFYLYYVVIEQFRPMRKEQRESQNAIAAIKAQKPLPNYTAKEKEDRYEAWKRVLKVLNTECTAANDMGLQLCATWEQEIPRLGKTGFNEKLDEFKGTVHACIADLRSVCADYPHLPDIASYFSQERMQFKELWTGRGALRDRVNRLESTTPNALSFLDEHIEKFKLGVRHFAAFIRESTAYSRQQITDLHKLPEEGWPK